MSVFKKRKIIILLAVVVCLPSFIIYLSRPIPLAVPQQYGVTFSRIFAEKTGLDWKETYLAILDDLKIKKLRLPVYWSLVEARQGIYDFEDVKWQMAEAEKRGVEVILVVGQKLPRWPECHIPEWARDLTAEEQQKMVLRYIEAAVKEFKDFKNLKLWQVENEPFLPFGECPKLDEEFLKKEIAQVRSSDNSHPVLVTDSGELGRWVSAVKTGDVFGTTMYFQTYTKFFGQIRYPIEPGFFRFKSRLADFLAGAKPKMVIEFQLEPWNEKQIYETSLDLQLNTFPVSEFDSRIEFVKKTGFDTVYLWGAEWWWWLKQKQGHPEYWEKAKRLYNTEDGF